MTSFLAALIRILLLALITYCFIVLFEHGPRGFAKGFLTEGGQLAAFARTLGRAAPLPPAPPAPTPPPAPEQASAPEATPSPPEIKGLERWRKLQERRIGEGRPIEDPVEYESP